jgi:hypothetical protein
VDRFESNDTRPVFENMPGETQFFQQGRTKELQTITEFSQGYAVPKYQNMTSEGEMGQDDQFPDTDYPMFRLAEAYLTYAEAKLRGGAACRWTLFWRSGVGSSSGRARAGQTFGGSDCLPAANSYGRSREEATT